MAATILLNHIIALNFNGAKLYNLTTNNS